MENNKTSNWANHQASKMRFRIAKLLVIFIIMIAAFIITLNATEQLLSAFVMAGSFAVASVLWVYVGQIIYAKRTGLPFQKVSQLCSDIKGTLVTVIGCLLWPLVLKALPKT